jgi:hypothetical protein
MSLYRLFCDALVLAFVLALCLATGASAQTGREDTSEYREAIALALQEFELGNYPEARAAFERAHQIYPNARTLRGMGLSAFEARDYVEAIELMSAATQNPEQPLTDEQKAEARNVIERAKGYVSKVEVQLSPQNAELAVDGRPVRLEGGELVLNPGDYQIQAQAEGRRAVTLSISAEAGRSTTITISLPPEEQAGARARSPWPYVVGGAGAALLITSAITGAMTSSAEEDLRVSCETGVCDEGARERGKSMQVATNVLLPFGAALLVSGVVWWVLDTPSTAADRASGRGGLAAGCMAGGCAIEARGTF